MKKIVAGALVLALLASPAFAGPKRPGLTGGSGATPNVAGTPTVGNVATVNNVPSGASVQWTRDGTNISGATASTYTLQSADGSHTVTAVITLVGLSVTAGAGSVGLDFSQSANSGYLILF